MALPPGLQISSAIQPTFRVISHGSDEGYRADNSVQLMKRGTLSKTGNLCCPGETHTMTSSDLRPSSLEWCSHMWTEWQMLWASCCACHPGVQPKAPRLSCLALHHCLALMTLRLQDGGVQQMHWSPIEILMRFTAWPDLGHNVCEGRCLHKPAWHAQSCNTVVK